MAKITKLFPWLPIRHKLLIAFTGLSLVPIIIIGMYGIASNTKMMKHIAIQNLSHDLALLQENTANTMAGIESDLHIIRNSFLDQSFVTIMDNHSHILYAHAAPNWGNRLLSFLKTREIYYQIRLIDHVGDEIACVRSTSKNSSNNSYEILNKSQMRKIPEVYYIYLVKNLLPNQIALAPAELHGQGKNLVPVISFAMPIFDRSNKVGILIADVYVKDLFSTFQTYDPLEKGEEVILTSSDGHYLYHSLEKKNWSKLLADRKEYNLRHDFSKTTANQIISNRKGIINSGGNYIISHTPVFPRYTSIFTSNMKQGFSIPLYLLVAIPKSVIMSPVHSYEYTFMGLLVLFLIVSISLSFLATKHFTFSIATLAKGAETITKGNYNYRVNVKTGDEIENLAEQFNLMAQSLSEREKEILQYRTHLEEMVASRTAELNTEKSKLQVILDNVPSAFLLLDKDLRIQTASAAFNTITGYKIDDVKGEHCARIFGSNGFCVDCICKRAIVENRIESCTNLKYNGEQQEKYLEHFAIPMREKGEVIAVLAVITDITKRKRMENILIKTEKLAATGEIAAFIAHEFRNSLTSIKMILQLMGESNNLSRTERKSVSVALNSTGEMEDTVTKLLNFAYPAPMKFQIASLRDILNESLAFVQLHFRKSRVLVKTEIEQSIPSIPLDVSHLREAIVNVLLNSVQSIEEKRDFQVSAERHQSTANEIHISVSTVFLKETLHDYKLEESVGYLNINNSNNNKFEITLPKGIQCLLLIITDTGAGIERKNIKKIFDPFFTTKTNGTGLGLPMLKRTINAHKGVVKVESRIGVGTTFKIFLPLSSEHYSLPNQF